MTSEKQIQANRANGAQSRGPTTDEGKRRSSINAHKHGLTATRLLVPGESPEEFLEFADAIWDAFGPQDGYEAGLVDQLISLLWRIRRVAEFEASLFTELILAETSNSLVYRITSLSQESDRNELKTRKQRRREQEDEEFAKSRESTELKAARAEYQQVQEQRNEPRILLARKLAADPNTLEMINRYETQIRRAITSTQTDIQRWRNARNGTPTSTVDVHISNDK